MKFLKLLNRINAFLEKRVGSRWILAAFIWYFIFIPFRLIYEPLDYLFDENLKDRRKSLKEFRQEIQVGEVVVVSLRKGRIVGRVKAIPTKWSKSFNIEYGKYDEASDTYSLCKKCPSSKIYHIHQTSEISEKIENY